MKLFKEIICAIFLLTFTASLFAQQPGTLDTTFDFDGKVVTSLEMLNDISFSIVVQNDGKIIAGGSTNNGINNDFALVRYNSNGTFDSTFGIIGKVVTPIDSGEDWLYEIALQNDGKIVAVGQSFHNGKWNFALVRYNSNGSLDSTFASNGVQTSAITPNKEYATTIRIDPNGRMYIGGSTGSVHGDFIIACYDSLGQLDSTFGNNGVAIIDLSNSDFISAIEIQSDGKIVAADGSSLQGFSGCPCFALLRFDSNGLLDSTFDLDGVVTTYISSNLSSVNSLIIQSDGKIIAGGGVEQGVGLTWDFAMIRYNSDGTIDSTFGTNGQVITSIGPNRDVLYKIKLQPDGKILAAGETGDMINNATNFVVARYNTNGTLDTTFGINGKVITDFGGYNDIAYSMDLQPDLKIVAAGQTYQNNKWNFALARYISGLNVGVVDFEKANNPMLIYPNPINQQATLKYTLLKNQTISIGLYDVSGRFIKWLSTGEVKNAGDNAHELMFDSAIPAGNYILTIQSGNSTQGIKIIKQ